MTITPPRHRDSVEDQRGPAEVRVRLAAVGLVEIGPVEIFIGLIAVGLVVYVVWRLVIRPRR